MTKRNFVPSNSTHQAIRADTWAGIFKQNRRLFHESKNRCVLLQTSIDDGTTDLDVRSYFDKYESGKIKDIYHVADGILLVLDNEHSADSVLSGKTITIGKRNIEVVKKKVPEVYEDRFYFEGSLQDSERVKNLLSNTFTTTFDMEEIETSKFVFTFQKCIGVEGIIGKINMHLFNQQESKAHRMVHTDCVRVTNLTKDVKNETVKSALMSKRNRGGKVTKVERNESEYMAYVYFANYRDAERIVERGKTQAIMVGSSRVYVSLHFCNKSNASVTIHSSSPKFSPSPEKRVKTTAQKGPVAFRKDPTQIHNFIDENLKITKSFYGSSLFIDYFKKHGTLIKDGPKKLKEVVLDFKTSDSKPFVAIKGKIGPVLEVLEWFDKVSKEMYSKERVINQPGMADYFESKRGQDEVKRISETYQCLGHVHPQNNKQIDQKEMFDCESQLLHKSADVTENAVQVIVKQRDVTSTNCRGIVNSTNNFDLTGAIGRAIVAKSGEAVEEELNHCPIVQTNTIRITSGGTLCKYIFHLSTPKNTNELKNVLVNCLIEADRLKLEDLAVPPVGTGGIGLPIVSVAKCLSLAIQEFRKTNPKILKKIEVNVLEPNKLPTFQQELLNETSQTMPQPLSILPKSESTENKLVSISFCSYNSTDVDKAFATVQELVNELSITKFIIDDAIEQLTAKEERDMRVIANRLNVSLEKVSCRHIRIQGLQTNVLEAHSQVSDLVYRFQLALQTSHYVLWKYWDQQDDTMKNFSIYVNHKLEHDYKENKQTSLVLSGEFWKIDFADMEATDMYGNKKGRVIRTFVLSNVTCRALSTWTDMRDQHWMTVTVDSCTLEYGNILLEFNPMMQLKPVQLLRVQNLTLWKQFEVQKQMIEQKMPNETVTKRLFHGTSLKSAIKISQEGFERNYAGKNGLSLGRGMYFATTAQYSTSFTKCDWQGCKCMILAEVVTGKYCQGVPSFQTVPAQRDGTPYDSVVDDEDSPNIFAVFRDACVYPLYILRYK